MDLIPTIESSDDEIDNEEDVIDEEGTGREEGGTQGSGLGRPRSPERGSPRDPRHHVHLCPPTVVVNKLSLGLGLGCPYANPKGSAP